jgi:hypothetical protein
MKWNATGTHKISRQRYLSTILESLPIIADTEQTSYELVCSGKRFGAYDVIVAATALERGSQVRASTSNISRG